MVPSLLHSMDSKSLKKLYLFASCGKELQCRRSMRRKIRFIEKEALVQKIRLQIAFPAILFILALVCVLGICVFLVKFIRKRRQQYRTLNLAWILKEIVLQGLKILRLLLGVSAILSWVQPPFGFPRALVDMLLRPLYNFIERLVGNTDVYSLLTGAAGLNVLPLILSWGAGRLYTYVEMRTYFWPKYHINPNGTPSPPPIDLDATQTHPHEQQYSWDNSWDNFSDNVGDAASDNIVDDTDSDSDSDSDTDSDESEEGGLATGSLLAEQPGGVTRAQSLLERACADGYQTCSHCNQIIASSRMSAHLLHWCPVLHNDNNDVDNNSDEDSEDSHLKID